MELIQASVLFFYGGSLLFYLLLLVIDPVLFVNLIFCGRLGGNIGEFGRNWLGKRTLTQATAEVEVVAVKKAEVSRDECARLAAGT
jgi:hypothetical protein